MVERFSPDPAVGLSGAQVQKRLAQGLRNTQPPLITKTTGQILREHTCTFFNALNVGIFLSLLLVQSYTNMLFIGVVLSNLLIGVIQEIRSKKTIEKLTLLYAPRARVIRDGSEHEIPPGEVVLDDVVRVALGDQILTDSIVLAGSVEVNESLLTGEPDAVTKRQGDMLLSGSVAVAGECRARVEKIGAEGYAASITLEAKKPRRIDSKLMKSLRLIIRVAGGVVLPLGLLLFIRAYFGGDMLKPAVEQAAGAILGMIPSGLILLTSMSLAAGVMTLSRKKALVQEAYCIETLARTDMLCLDKTGTLTTGNMQSAGMEYLADDHARANRLVAAYAAHAPAHNATAKAIFECYAKQAPPMNMLGYTPFSSARRYSAVSFDEGTVYLGALKSVCPDADAALCARVDALSGEGMRVLVAAFSGQCNAEPPTVAVARPEPFALVLLLDEIRPEAKDTLRFFEDEGVAVRLISGDDPRTVAHIARRLALPGHDQFVDVSALSNDEDVARAALTYTVFGRVSPHRKRLILRALQSAGHTVAMTGDGVNDLLALREADCSIALNGGSDAARQASHLVLLSNDFSVLPGVVMEGRRVINNITRTASLFLVKTIFSFLLSVSSVLFGSFYPFQPIQLSLIGALAVGIPSFILAMEPNRTRVKGNFIKNVLVKALPGALCVFFYSIIAGIIAPQYGFDQIQVNTLCLYLAGTAGLCVLLRVCMPFNKLRAALWILMTGTFFASTALFDGLFKLEWIRGGTMLTIYLVMSATCIPLLIVLEKLLRKLMRADIVKQKLRELKD